MKFVVTCPAGSEFTASWDEHIPVEYESLEALYIDLNAAILEGLDGQKNWMKPNCKWTNCPEEIFFAGRKFFLDWFDQDDPEPVPEYYIQTLEQWFETYKVK